MNRYVVGRASDIPEGEHRIVDVNGRRVGIYNVRGSFHALLSRCPHQGADLCSGTVAARLRSEAPGHFELDEDERFVICPWHGWEFDVKTGQSWFDARRTRARRYDVNVSAGQEITAALQADATARGGRIKGPYVAETIEVSRDEDYLVISMVR